MRWHLTYAAAILFATTGMATAQTSLRVQPLSVEAIGPSQASSVTLKNNGSNEIAIQLRVFEWTQVNGEDKLTPTTDVVASPPVTRIPGGGSYTVRVARTAGAVSTGEKSYRLWVDELPLATPSRQDGAEVDVRLRYDLPVFFHGPTTRSKLGWRAYRSGGNIIVEASNTGTQRARITGLKLAGPNGDVSLGEGLNGYVLAGSVKRWTAPATGLPDTASAKVSVVAGVSGSEVRQPITITRQ